jgi:hypothetical protein
MKMTKDTARIEVYALAPGSFDIDENGKTIASLVRVSSHRSGWVAELFRNEPIRPPFTSSEHSFASLIDALKWLGDPPKKIRDGFSPRR